MISRFMIFFGTPIALLLMMDYLALAANPPAPVAFYSCMIECIAMGPYCGCLIGMVFSRIFQYDLGADWNDIVRIRIYASSPILVLHPVSLWFIDWLTIGAMSMTLAWVVAAVDLKMHGKVLEPSSAETAGALDVPVEDIDV